MVKETRSAKKTRLLGQVYLIYGREKLLLDEALDRLKERVAEQADLNFNYDQFRGGESEVARIINACKIVPFASDKRLVVVKDAEKLSASDISILSDYAKHPLEQTCLVLVAGELKRKDRLFKSFYGKAEVHEYKPPRPQEYPTWIKKEFSTKGKKISNALAEYLYVSVGTDLGKLRGEVDKLCLFYRDRDKLDVEEAREVVKRSSEASIFDLVDLLGKKQKAEALETLRNLLKTGADPLRIFYMVVRQLRLLIKAKVLVEEGVSDRKLAEELGLPLFIVFQYKRQSQRFSVGQLKEGLKLLLEADLAFKTSSRDKEQVLELLIHRVLVT